MENKDKIWKEFVFDAFDGLNVIIREHVVG